MSKSAKKKKSRKNRPTGLHGKALEAMLSAPLLREAMAAAIEAGAAAALDVIRRAADVESSPEDAAEPVRKKPKKKVAAESAAQDAAAD